jgi:ABC-type branched-subunit amino acid transport system substrate-binding protein
MRASRLALAVFAGTLAALAVGCGGSETPVKIGVLTDCQGPFHAFEDAQLAGAELPLLERGATMRGTAPTDGLTAGTVAGRKVELVRGCAESGEHTVFIEEARRLVEKERVDVIVGGVGTVIRDVARLYPTVPFVATFWDEQEVTLRDAPSNLYRYTLDYGQQSAGLGRYAYSDLGWRRASVLASDSTQGWGSTAAFVAEFCALGGTIVDQVYLSPFTPVPDPGAEVQKGAHPKARAAAEATPPLEPVDRGLRVSYGPRGTAGRRRVDILDPGRPSLGGVGGLPAPLCRGVPRASC